MKLSQLSRSIRNLTKTVRRIEQRTAIQPLQRDKYLVLSFKAISRRIRMNVFSQLRLYASESANRDYRLRISLTALDKVLQTRMKTYFQQLTQYRGIHYFDEVIGGNEDFSRNSPTNPFESIKIQVTSPHNEIIDEQLYNESQNLDLAYIAGAKSQILQSRLQRIPTAKLIIDINQVRESKTSNISSKHNTPSILMDYFSDMNVSMHTPSNRPQIKHLFNSCQKKIIDLKVQVNQNIFCPSESQGKFKQALETHKSQIEFITQEYFEDQTPPQDTPYQLDFLQYCKKNQKQKIVKEKPPKQLDLRILLFGIFIVVQGLILIWKSVKYLSEEQYL